jgi:hypothetical protein
VHLKSGIVIPANAGIQLPVTREPPVHEPAQACAVRWLQHGVKVIRENGEREHPNWESVLGCSEETQEGSAKDRLTIVASIHDVIERPCNVDAGNTRHQRLFSTFQDCPHWGGETAR